MTIVLTIIALQQVLFAIGWAVSGLLLGLSRRAAAHWVGAALAMAAGLMLIAQRGVWPGWVTVAVANLLVVGGFVLVRRGVQVFLRLRRTDVEAALVLAAVALTVGYYLVDPTRGAIGRLAVSGLIAWTMLRCAHEARRALRRSGDPGAARVVSFPLALMGAIYVVRVIAGVINPTVALHPVNVENPFNGGVVVLFMVAALLLNMVLAYMVAHRLVRRLHQLAIRDPLTGLLNRRGLGPRLGREAARMRRYGEPYALLALDIDRFKSVNDRYGHAAGDAVLVQLGALLRDVGRDVDTAARIGGEEFCLLLTNSSVAGACQVADRLCRVVRETAWMQVEGGVTVSIGVAVAAAADASPTAVMERADAALMRAKADGRDRVVVSNLPAAAPPVAVAV